MKILRNILFVISILLLHNNLYAQIVNTNANYERVVHNTYAGDSTFIFTYFSSNTRAMTIKGVSLDTPADFKWYRFVNSSQTIDPAPFRVDNGVTESVIPVSEGGYLLTVHNGTVTDTFRTWIFYDIMGIDSVTNIQSCEFLQLTAHVHANRSNFTSYDYFDFCDLNNILNRFISNTFTVEWNASTDIYAGLPNMPQGWKTRVNSLITRISPTPLKDATYSARITNVFGNKSEEFNTALITAMGVYAAFDVLVPDNMGIYKPTTNLKGEALFRMKLENKSISADKFEWVGWNDQTINFLREDTLWVFYTENVFQEFEYKPGQYPVKLTVENSRTGCRHSTYSLNSNGVRSDIIVDNSAFAPESLPNVFTPNGDGNNDFFIFVKDKEPVSMRTIDLKIYGRNGNLVYKYFGNISSWNGWNGKMNGNGSDCSSGVYYYVISGEGWDNKSFSGKPYTGSLHLFRGN